MSCSISRIATSAGSAARAARMSCRSSSGTPAAGSSSSSTRGRWPAPALSPAAAACRRRACASAGRSRPRGRSGSAAPRSRRRSPVCPPATRQKSEPRLRARRSPGQATSAGVRSGNSWLIWNVRDRPIRTRALDESAVTSRPSSSTSPSVGFSTPVSRLISVVLPAPLGPISACRAPGSTRTSHCRWRPGRRNGA